MQKAEQTFCQTLLGVCLTINNCEICLRGRRVIHWQAGGGQAVPLEELFVQALCKNGQQREPVIKLSAASNNAELLVDVHLEL